MDSLDLIKEKICSPYFHIPCKKKSPKASQTAKFISLFSARISHFFLLCRSESFRYSFGFFVCHYICLSDYHSFVHPSDLNEHSGFDRCNDARHTVALLHPCVLGITGYDNHSLHVMRMHGRSHTLACFQWMKWLVAGYFFKRFRMSYYVYTTHTVTQ